MRATRILLTVTIALALTISASSTVYARPFNPATPPPAESGWSNGQVVHFYALAVLLPSNPHSYEEFYIIAPIDQANPQGTEIFGPHDHTLTDPSNARDKEYSAVWIVLLAAKGPSANSTNVRTLTNMVDTNLDGTPDTQVEFVSHADTNNDGTLEPLTSMEVIEAAEDAGLVVGVETGVAFICPVIP